MNGSCHALEKIESYQKRKYAILNVERARYFCHKKEIFEHKHFLFGRERCATLTDFLVAYYLIFFSFLFFVTPQEI